jgi:hypothetical protein
MFGTFGVKLSSMQQTQARAALTRSKEKHMAGVQFIASCTGAPGKDESMGRETDDD